MYGDQQLRERDPAPKNFLNTFFGTIDCTRITRPCDQDVPWCNLPPDRSQENKKSYFRRKVVHEDLYY